MKVLLCVIDNLMKLDGLLVLNVMFGLRRFVEKLATRVTRQ